MPLLISHSQPYRIEPPVDATQTANVDEMFQILFDDLKKVIDVINALNVLSTAQIAARISLRV